MRALLIFVYLLFFSYISNGNSELMKNRYAVREHYSIKLKCEHSFTNVTRYRWDCISNQNNTQETIFDNQSNKTLKIGFKVVCLPHCNINLVQARKEDSGKYICFVGWIEENETIIDSNLMQPVTEIELVIRSPKKQTKVVNIGDYVVLPCEHNIKNLTRARWDHHSIDGTVNHNLYRMKGHVRSSNYESKCEPHQLLCDLIILQVNKETAGRYDCMVGDSIEYEDKYGLDSMTHFIEIEVVVGEIACNENTFKELTFLGENDCYGTEPDVLNLKCSFSYHGNIDHNNLHLRWIGNHKFNSSQMIHKVEQGTNIISIQSNLSVTYEMKNSIFQCILDDTNVKPCQFKDFTIQYVKNASKRSAPIYSNDLHNIKCEANKSKSVQCSYYWVHEIGGAMLQNPYPILPVENMNTPGNYTCIAKCALDKNRECFIKAMDFEVLQSPITLDHQPLHNGSYMRIQCLLISLIVMVSLLVITSTTYLIYSAYQRKKNKRYGKFSGQASEACNGDAKMLMSEKSEK